MNRNQEKNDQVKKKKKPTSMFNATKHGLLFVTLWGIIATYYHFGLYYAIRSTLMVVIAVITAYLTHVIFYMIEDKITKKSYTSNDERKNDRIKKIKRGVPELTGIIVALCFQLATPLYIVVLSVILAEIVGKLMWGGFGKNKLNPAAVGFLLTSVLFGYYQNMPVLNPVVDSITSATPLSIIGQNGWHFTDYISDNFNNQFGGIVNLLIGRTPGPLAEMSRLASILALVYMVYKKAIKWTVPLFYLGTIVLVAIPIGLIHGFPLTYPLYHILNGGVIFAAVFMATDPVTIPKSIPGKAIFAMLMGVLTFILRIRFMAFPEGVMFSIVIMNLFTDYISEKTAKLAKASNKLQWQVYGIIGLVSVVIVILLGFTMPY